MHIVTEVLQYEMWSLSVLLHHCFKRSARVKGICYKRWWYYNNNNSSSSSSSNNIGSHVFDLSSVITIYLCVTCWVKIDYWNLHLADAHQNIDDSGPTF
jgi:hypothetical protein